MKTINKEDDKCLSGKVHFLKKMMFTHKEINKVMKIGNNKLHKLLEVTEYYRPTLDIELIRVVTDNDNNPVESGVYRVIPSCVNEETAILFRPPLVHKVCISNLINNVRVI